MDKRMLMCLILKGLDAEGNLVNEQDLGISRDEYFEVLDNMQEDGLVEGLKFIKSGKSNRIIDIVLNYIEITADGIQYLNENWFYGF